MSSIKQMVKKVLKEIEVKGKSVPVPISNEIAPTEKMVKEVILLYLDSVPINEIKNTIKKDKTNLKLTYEQIKEIIKEYKLQTLEVDGDEKMVL